MQVSKIVLTRLDGSVGKLSTGSAVTLLCPDDIIDEETLRALLRNMVKEDVSIEISSARLVVSHHWE